MDTFFAAYFVTSEEHDKIFGRLYVTNQQLLFVKVKHVFFRIKLHDVLQADKKGFRDLEIIVKKRDGPFSFHVIARDAAYNCISEQLKQHKKGGKSVQ